MTKPPLTLYLAAPRGFCAGVDRAIKIVEMAIEKWGAPVYVRHEIVHNKFVVDGLRERGAIFVEELLSVYFTVRQYGSLEVDASFEQTLVELREQCEELMDSYVIDQVLRPLAQAISTK